MSALAVIGHYPEYLELARELDARAFEVAADVWRNMSADERWTRNRAFLDDALADGCVFRLATPPERMRPESYFAREVEYLLSCGCVASLGDGVWELRP